jgi:beta-glucuronidase
VFSESVRLDEAEAELVRDIELPGTPLWTPETPTLHLLRVELGEDDWQQRIGIRQVQVRRGTLCLNGKPLQIRGMNRHEAHPGFGHSVPLSQQLADLQLLKDCGCNFVRGSHYPQDPNFLDLCDELGICVYSEAIGWQHTEEQLIAPHFVDAQSAHIREMVDAAYNHPSVIMWGILNESESASPACRNTFERLLSQVRLADPTRPVAFASNRHQRDICLDLCDVVCMNAYPGWYFETPDRIAAWLDQLFSELRQKVPDVPILISEIGAGALLGVRDANRQHWTEDYQAEVLQRVLAHLLASSTDCIGVCLWQFCDCRVGQNAEAAMRRPRGFNNKGIFDEFRRPKLARDVVRRCFRRASIKARSPRPDE